MSSNRLIIGLILTSFAIVIFCSILSARQLLTHTRIPQFKGCLILLVLAAKQVISAWFTASVLGVNYWQTTVYSNVYRDFVGGKYGAANDTYFRLLPIAKVGTQFRRLWVGLVRLAVISV